MAQENKSKAGKRVVLGLKIVLNVIFYAIILVVLLFSIANIRGKNKADNIPNIFGKGYLTVQSDSMTGTEKDSFSKGDLIIVDIPSQKEIENLEAGDVVTFADPYLKQEGISSQLNTHRILYKATINDNLVFYTVGDKIRLELDSVNGEAFDYLSDDFQNLSYEEAEKELIARFGMDNVQQSGVSQIKGIYSSKISGFGKVIDTINDNFLVCIVLPIVLFLLFEIAVFVYNLILVKNESKKSAASALSNEEREKLKEQLRVELMQELKKDSENKE